MRMTPTTLRESMITKYYQKAEMNETIAAAREKGRARQIEEALSIGLQAPNYLNKVTIEEVEGAAREEDVDDTFVVDISDTDETELSHHFSITPVNHDGEKTFPSQATRRAMKELYN